MAIIVSPDRVILTGISCSEAELREISYIEASYEASWTDVSVFAQVSFPDVLTVEVINPLDRIALATTKPAVDSFNANIDFSTRQLQKALKDVLVTLDGPEFTFDYGARESETQVVVEHLKYSINRLLAPETMHLIDNMDGDIQYAIVKVVGELQLLNDFSTRNLNKKPSDVLSASDVIYAYIVVIRAFTETLATSDFRFVSVQKALADVAVSSENKAYSLAKPLLDTATPSEAKALLFDKLIMGVESDYTLPYPEPAYFAERYVGGQVGEILTTTDDFISQRIYGRFPLDAVNLGESGVVSMQNYVALDYLAEDYVGVGRTF